MTLEEFNLISCVTHHEELDIFDEFDMCTNLTKKHNLKDVEPELLDRTIKWFDVTSYGKFMICLKHEG